jgi:hypothetical protein
MPLPRRTVNPRATNQVTVEKAVETAKMNAPNIPPSTDPTEIAIIKIIPDLASDNADKRHKARSDLALFGQNAVKPLLREVQKRALTRGHACSSLGEPCCSNEAAHRKLQGLVPTRSLAEFELKDFEGKCAFFAL